MVADDCNAQWRWTPEAIVHQGTVGEVSLSPDGSEVVYTWVQIEDGWDEASSKLIYASPLDEYEIALTEGYSYDDSPQWCPDGTTLLFLSDRASWDEDADVSDWEYQLWEIYPDGGEAAQFTDIEGGGVEQFAWLGTEQVLVLARDLKSLKELEAEASYDLTEAVESETEFPPARLFLVDAYDGTVTRFTENDDQIVDFAAAPDGSAVLTIHKTSPFSDLDANVPYETYLQDGSGRRKAGL